MKRITEGYLYDTAHAKPLAKHESTWSNYGTYHLTSTLYKTEAGRYFVHETNERKLSRWAKFLGIKNPYGWEQLDPMTLAEVQEWLIEHKITCDEVPEPELA